MTDRDSSRFSKLCAAAEGGSKRQSPEHARPERSSEPLWGSTGSGSLREPVPSSVVSQVSPLGRWPFFQSSVVNLWKSPELVTGHSGVLEKGSGKISLEMVWETVKKDSDQKQASGNHENSPSMTYTQKGTAAGKHHR